MSVVDRPRPIVGCLVVTDVQTDDPDSRGTTIVSGVGPLAINASNRFAPGDAEGGHHLLCDLTAKAERRKVSGAGKLPVRAQERRMDQVLRLPGAATDTDRRPNGDLVADIVGCQTVLIEE